MGFGAGESAPSIISSRSGSGTRPPSHEVSISLSGTAQSFLLYGIAKCLAIPAPHTLYMNSSKFRGSSRAPAVSGSFPNRADASRIPSAQQSFTLVLHAPFVPFACPFACPFTRVPFPCGLTASAPFNAPNRASIAPTTHSLITCGGSPYNDPWNGYRVYTFLL